MISIRVYGTPRPGGSKRGFVVGKRAILTDANPNVGEWKQDVKVFAKQTYKDAPLTGPLYVDVSFVIKRPKAHYKTDGTLRPKFEYAYPTSKPDATKLMRPTEDALTGILWVDDALIVTQKVSKRYGEKPGAHIIVMSMDEFDEKGSL